MAEETIKFAANNFSPDILLLSGDYIGRMKFYYFTIIFRFAMVLIIGNITEFNKGYHEFS